MGIVAEDAVNQFEALMNQGQLLKSFSPSFFLSYFPYKPLTLLSFLAVDEPLKKTFQVLFFLPFSDLFLYMGQFVFIFLFLFFLFFIFIFFSVYDYILYIIYYILLDFWLLAEMNLQSHQLVSFLENVFFCLCL